MTRRPRLQAKPAGRQRYYPLCANCLSRHETCPSRRRASQLGRGSGGFAGAGRGQSAGLAVIPPAARATAVKVADDQIHSACSWLPDQSEHQLAARPAQGLGWHLAEHLPIADGETAQVDDAVALDKISDEQAVVRGMEKLAAYGAQAQYGQVARWGQPNGVMERML